MKVMPTGQEGDTLAQPVESDVIRVSPEWADNVFWVLLGMLGFAVILISVIRLEEQAEGTGIVRLSGQRDIVALTSSVVESVDVLPGARVEKGDVLARFVRQQDHQALKSTQEQLDRQMASALRDVSDAAKRSALLSLKVQRDEIVAKLEAGVVRAPARGIVSNLRIRPGQAVATGELLASIVSDSTRFSIIAVLPGQYRPKLKPGMPLRLEFEGYHDSLQLITIGQVSNEIVGPTEVKRFLGEEVAETLAMEGAQVLVQAELPGPTFAARGGTFPFHQGLQARVSAVLEERSAWSLILPDFGGGL
jgi:membrane fusion protein (multidrug efflux system)